MAAEGTVVDCFELQVVGCIGMCLMLMALVELEEPDRIEELEVDIEQHLMVAASVCTAEPLLARYCIVRSDSGMVVVERSIYLLLEEVIGSVEVSDQIAQLVGLLERTEACMAR